MPTGPAAPTDRAEPQVGFFNPANLLSLSRIPLAALVWVNPSSATYVFVLMVLAGATDLLDGWVARQVLGFGRSKGSGDWVDPLCDKVFVASAVVAVIVAHSPPLYVPPLVMTREIIQFGMVCAAIASPTARRRRRVIVPSSLVGKATTAAQFIAVAAVFVRPDLVPEIAAVAGALGLIAGIGYVRQAFGGAEPSTSTAA